MSLKLSGLSLSIGDKALLTDVSLEVSAGQVVALMGPNGCGKSSLALALAGHPGYQISDLGSQKSEVLLDSKDILGMTPDERSRAGLFLAFQHPVSVPGVTVTQMLTAAIRQREKEGVRQKALAIKELIRERAAELGIKEDLLARDVNDGLSGGEKKRMEMLQLLVLAPKYAILDETDSGLDIDALKIVGKVVRKAADNGMGILVITHYQRLLRYLQPNKVVVLGNGGVAKTGGSALIDQIEEVGYKGTLLQ